MNGGKGHLTIRDNSGKNLYDGPYKPGQKVKNLPQQWQDQLKEIDIQARNGKDDPKKGKKKKGQDKD
jgi:hypothetical protein